MELTWLPVPVYHLDSIHVADLANNRCLLTSIGLVHPLDRMAGPVRPIEVAAIQGHPIGVEQVGQEHRPITAMWRYKERVWGNRHFVQV